MATTTFNAVRLAVVPLITALTPIFEPQIKFIQADDRDRIEEHPITHSLTRKFQLESGGISGWNSLFRSTLVRDAHKELIVKVAYLIADDHNRILKMADEDEHQIAYTLNHFANFPSGVLEINLRSTTHGVTENRRMVNLSFDVHYEHSAV